MSDTKIGVEFSATTAAAVAEVDKLSAAVRETTTAAKGAGKEQQTLGREVKQTRAVQIEATEAMRRANDAQKIHTLTVQKLGAASREAKDSAAKLSAAQAESKRAALAAAVALEKTAKAAQAAAAAEDGNLSPATKRAAAQLERMGKDAERTARDLHLLDLQTTAAATGTSRLGKSMSALTVAGGTLIAGGISRGFHGIVGGIKDAGTSAIEFQSTMTGLTKVLADTSPGNLAAIDSQIKTMAVSLGVMPEAIADMSKELAQSGLQDDLMGYTEDAAKLGVAFDLTGKEAGSAIAGLTASLGLSREEMQVLMGTANQISDGMNATGKDLVDYMQNVAGIGRSAGVTGETMLALGASIIATGTAPDKAATGVKNLIATLESGSAATKAQVEAFHKLGFEAEAVAKQMATGGAEEQIKAIAAAIAGLPPEERFASMIDLFGKESIGSVGGLATNVDLLGTAFKIAGDKAGAASSVQKEYERVSQTTAHTLAQLKATVSVTAIEVGSVLLPEINAIAKDIGEWVTQNRELIKVNVAGAVKTITQAARDLWPVLKTVASTVATVTETVGAGNLAYIAMGAKVLSLTNDIGGFAVKATTTMIPALAGMTDKLGKLAGPAGLFVVGSAGVAALTFETLKFGSALAKSIMSTDGQADALARLAAKAQEANIRMTAVRLEAMQNEVNKTKGSIAQTTEDMAKTQRALDAGFSNEARAEAVKVAGLKERARLIKEMGHTDLDELQVQKLKVGVLRAMADERERYNRAANDAGNGISAPIAIKAGMSDKDKKAAARGAKQKGKFAEDSRDFDVEMQQYAAKETKRIREENIASQQAAWEAEEALFGHKETAFDRELEIIGALGLAEEDAQKARETLIDRRLNAERDFAQAQLRMAKTDAQREQAKTRMEATEHQRRLVALRKMAAAEEAEQARKVALTEKITARVTDLGGAMVQAAWDAAEGQKGAGLKALGDYLQTVSKQMAIKALVETALGVSALAGIVTAGLAPGHFAAAGMAAAVAVAAGGAGIGLSAAGDARAESGTPKARDEAPSGPAGVGQAGSSGGTSDREKRDLDAQEVPISYFDPSKMQGSANMGPTINIDLSGGTWIGAKGPEAAAQEINKILRQGRAGGAR